MIRPVALSDAFALRIVDDLIRHHAVVTPPCVRGAPQLAATDVRVLERHGPVPVVFCLAATRLELAVAGCFPLGAEAELVAGMDLSDVRDDLCALMFDRSHDDGSYAPLLIRFAWHCCGTWDAASGTGGSNGGTMRFAAEQADPENAGLGKARGLLAPVVAKYASRLSTADVWVLAGYVALDCTGAFSFPACLSHTRTPPPTEPSLLYLSFSCRWALSAISHRPAGLHRGRSRGTPRQRSLPFWRRGSQPARLAPTGRRPRALLPSHRSLSRYLPVCVSLAFCLSLPLSLSRSLPPLCLSVSLSPFSPGVCLTG